MISKVLRSATRQSQRAFSSTKPFNYQLLQLDEVRTGLRESAEKFAQEEIAPIAAEIDKNDKMPYSLWKRMGDMGFLGITVEEDYGGAGLGYFEHCLVVEEISKASGSVGLSYLAHSNLCVNQIRLNGNDA